MKSRLSYPHSPCHSATVAVSASAEYHAASLWTLAAVSTREDDALVFVVMPTRRARTTNAIAIIDVTLVRNFEDPVPKVESDDPPKMPPSPWLLYNSAFTCRM